MDFAIINKKMKRQLINCPYYFASDNVPGSQQCPVPLSFV